MLKVAQELERDGGTVEWFSFQKEYDSPVIDRLQAAGHRVWIWDPETMETSEVYAAIADFACVVTARMHGTYVAGMLGIPVVSICLHPKLKFAAEYFSNSASVSAEPSPDELGSAIKRLMPIAEETTEDSQQASANARDDIKTMLSELDAWIGN